MTTFASSTLDRSLFVTIVIRTQRNEARTSRDDLMYRAGLHHTLGSRVDLPQRPLAQLARDVHRAAPQVAASKGQNHGLLRAVPTRAAPLPELDRVLRELEASLVGT